MPIGQVYKLTILHFDHSWWRGLCFDLLYLVFSAQCLSRHQPSTARLFLKEKLTFFRATAPGNSPFTPSITLKVLFPSSTCLPPSLFYLLTPSSLGHIAACGLRSWIRDFRLYPHPHHPPKNSLPFSPSLKGQWLRVLEKRFPSDPGRGTVSVLSTVYPFLFAWQFYVE